MNCPPEIRQLIKQIPQDGGFFQNFPGVYCKSCGEVYALYSYSFYKPDGIDEDSKPYYNCCAVCKQKDKL